MSLNRWNEKCWGQHAKFRYVFICAVFLLFGMLGSHELWTQEHRWADIVTNMFYYHDFLHPNLEGDEYYDKPLLSYWLIAAISYLTGVLNTFVLRTPSALAGLLALWSIYRLGMFVKDKQLGMLASWMLLTSYFFVFWARVSSADMLNLAGSLFGVVWYVEKRDSTTIWNYTVFFLILAVTASCKGLVGPAVTILAILPDLLRKSRWKQHLNVRFLIAMLPAILIYILPFWASTYYSLDDYNQNGLYQVYRENILRYFRPFDHKDPFYLYFICLPIYLFPWVFFFIPALYSLKSRWSGLSQPTQWMVWATLTIFIFFTLSGSRRGYYILPLMPYAILMTAEWILSSAQGLKQQIWAGRTLIVSLILMLFLFVVVQPLYYSHGGVKYFGNLVQKEASKIKPWSAWNIVLLDPESRVTFYMHLSPDLHNFDTNQNGEVTQKSLLKVWPILKQQPKDTILITRQLYVPFIADLLKKDYVMVEAEPMYFDDYFKSFEDRQPVAFIPKNLG